MIAVPYLVFFNTVLIFFYNISDTFELAIWVLEDGWNTDSKVLVLTDDWLWGQAIWIGQIHCLNYFSIRKSFLNNFGTLISLTLNNSGIWKVTFKDH